MSISSTPPAAGAARLTEYWPFYLCGIANAWTSSSSRIYRREFGLGVVEWRVLAALSASGHARSLDIANISGVDAAAVSRAVVKLEQQGLVSPVAGKFSGRTRPIELTDAGRAMFQRINEIAAKRQDAMLAEMDANERAELLRLLRKLYEKLPYLLTDADVPA